jgi:hypothetical protein
MEQVEAVAALAHPLVEVLLVALAPPQMMAAVAVPAVLTQAMVALAVEIRHGTQPMALQVVAAVPVVVAIRVPVALAVLTAAAAVHQAAAALTLAALVVLALLSSLMSP